MGEREMGKNKQKDEVVEKKPPRPEKMILLQQNICGSGHPSFKEKKGKFLLNMFYLDVL